MNAASSITGPAAHQYPDPERLLVVPVIEHEGGLHCVLVRWPDWPALALLSAPTPGATDTIEAIVADLVRARLGLELESPPAVAKQRLPVQMLQPRAGAQGTGWLRPVLVRVRGAIETDALLDGAELVPVDAAPDALSTSLERSLVGLALALLDDGQVDLDPRQTVD